MCAGTGSDTSEEAAQLQLDLLRRASPTQRLEACLALSRSLIALSRAVLRERRPGVDEQEILLEWAEINYGSELVSRVRSDLASRR